jgi:HAD superfamily hydrolase (TIGR01509 family)
VIRREPQTRNSIRGVIFDLDGTLFDSEYDWPAIKRRLGVTRRDGSILEFLDSLPAAEASSKRAELERLEDRATRDGVLKPGARQLLVELSRRGCRLALVTNNRDHNAREIVRRYRLGFEAIVTRDSGAYKPSPEPLLRAAAELRLDPRQLAAVGDNEFDLRAARSAGMGLVLIVNTDVDRFRGRCDAAVPDLGRLQAFLLARLDRSGPAEAIDGEAG